MWGENWGEMIWTEAIAHQIQVTFAEPWMLVGFMMIIAATALAFSRRRLNRS